MKKITVIVLMLFTALSYAQVGINIATPHASSALDITSTTGGLLVPRMTEVQRDDINSPSNPATGLMIYQTDDTAGFYYYNGSSWEGYYSKVEVDALIANLQSKTEARVGDIRAGGVVFWVDPFNKRHGLVCAFSDYSTYVEWGCSGTDLSSVSNVPYNGGNFGSGAEIGDGVSNTNAILQDCPTAAAALAARSYGPDWFLPSVKELNQMYINKTTLEGVSGFSAFSNYYWSSTENDGNLAWEQYFNDGYQNNGVKYSAGYVRAVRAF